jgi:3-methyladenine DNA glycosylase AlkD
MIRSVRVGRYVPESQCLADALLGDSDDAVQKALGWLLKETCKGDRAAVVGYLQARRDRLSRVAWRIARERLTSAERILTDNEA